MSAVSIPIVPQRLGCVLVRADYLYRNLNAMKRVTDKDSRVMLTASSDDRLRLRVSSGPYVVEVIETAIQLEQCFSCAVPAKLLRDIAKLADGEVLKLELSAPPRPFDPTGYNGGDGDLTLTVTDRSGMFKLWAYTHDVEPGKFSKRHKSTDGKTTAGILADLKRLDDRPPMKFKDGAIMKYAGQSYTFTVTADEVCQVAVPEPEDPERWDGMS